MTVCIFVMLHRGGIIGVVMVMVAVRCIVVFVVENI